MKRCFDMVIASLMLVLTSPLLLLVALIVRASLGAPVLFRQDRPGLEGKLFRLAKFRTMNSGRGSDGEPLPDDQRLTGLGKFLRASSLDELPEFWNVLKGEMSLVGPRPLLEEYLPLYNERQARRHEVRPGLTGWAQVNGRNAVKWEDRLEMDVWYVENQSFALDMKILFQTVWVILSRRGVSAEGEATMAKFTGSESPPESAPVGEKPAEIGDKTASTDDVSE